MVLTDSASQSFSNQTAWPDVLLVGGGEMGKLIRHQDWSQTPLGPIESWPQSLRTTVILALASNFPIAIAWGPHHIQIYNDGYWPICGEKHPQSMGQDFTECWASPWPVIGDAFEQALMGETSFLEDQRMFLDRNGYLEETFFTFSFSPIRDESGKVGGLFHPVTEQTTKMLSERRTRVLRDLAQNTSKAKLVKDVFALAADTLSQHNLDVPFCMFYEVLDSNQTLQLKAMTGLEVETSVCLDVVDLKKSSIWPFAEVLQNGIAIQVNGLEQQLSFCGPYPEVPKTAYVFPILMPGGTQPQALFVVGISSRLPFNEMYHSFLELLTSTISAAVGNARAYEEERKRAEALAEIDRAKTAFFSNVSHEFRTPLTLMLGPLEDALQDVDTIPENQVRLDIAYRNALRLLKLVNSLLDFSRIEANRVEASYEPTDLASQTSELASMFRSAIEKAGLKLIVRCEPLPELIYVDRDMWEKIVLNLLSNAFKHTFSGEIEVSLLWKTDHVELLVRDTGVGIAPEQLPRLFERFYRVPNVKSRTHEGTGIGLALVNELVKLHGGNIQVQSLPEQGTCFTVAIPTGMAHLAAEHIHRKSSLVSTALGAQPFVEEALRWLPGEDRYDTTSDAEREHQTWWYKTANGDKVRIVLADDNRDMRDYVCRLLSPYCLVEAVPDGESALTAIRRHPPDLVLSDIMMPKMDGFELLAALKSEESLKTIPVVLLSARAGEEARVEGLQAGADDYLVKPFNTQELLARIKANLNLDLHRARQEAEMAKQQSEEQYKRLFNQAAAGIAQTDLSGKFILVNQRYCEMIGRNQDELMGLTMQELTHPEDLPDNLLAIQQLLTDGIPFAIEKRYIRPNGSHIWVLNHVALIQNAEGNPQGTLAISQDITDRKKAEIALEKAQEDLKTYAGKLERSNKDLEHFAMIASHDLQEPLRKVMMFSDHLKIISQDKLSDEGRDDIERMQRATIRMQNLIDDLLDLSRVTRQTKPFQKVDLNEVVEEVLADLSIQLKEVGGQIDVGPMMTIEADFGQIRQLLSSLINNALKFHRVACPPVIKISTQPFDPQYCQIVVEDNGIGIKKEHYERIFEIFTRLHSKTDYPGTGIGLAMVKKIVERHNGTVKVESVPEQGSTFTVILPIQQYLSS